MKIKEIECFVDCSMAIVHGTEEFVRTFERKLTIVSYVMIKGEPYDKKIDVLRRKNNMFYKCCKCVRNFLL